MWKRTRHWYYGPWVSGESHPGYSMGGSHRPHWTAWVAQRLVEFSNQHWHKLILIGIGVSSVVVAAMK
jgi:hypothetical protein